MADSNTSGMWSGLGTASVSGGIGGLLGLAGNALNYRYNKNLAQQQQDFNVQNAAQAQNYALAQQENSASLSYQNWLKQFEAQNEQQKNLLLHQKAMEVQAMRNAGLNPALAGGGVANVSVAGTSSSAPSGSGPLAQAGLAHAQGESLASGFSSGAMAGSAASLLDEQADNIRANTLDKLADVANKDAWRDPTTNNIIQDTATKKAQELKTEAETFRIHELTPVEKEKLEQEIKYLSAQEKAILEKLPHELNLLVSEAILNSAKTSEAEEHASLYREQEKTERTQQSLNGAMAGYYRDAGKNQRAQASYYVEKGKEVKQSIKYLTALTDLTENEALEALEEAALKDYLRQKQETITPQVQRYIDMAENAWFDLCEGAGIVLDAVTTIKSANINADSRVRSAQIGADSRVEAARNARHAARRRR